MFLRREILSLGATAVGLAASVRALAQSTVPDRSAAEVAERLVEAMGGRDNWLRVKGLSIAARHYELSLVNPHDNRLYVATEQPLMRFEAHGEGIDQVRVITRHKGSYRNRGQTPRPLSDAQVKSDLEWWETHVYRNIRRLALRDPALTPRLHGDGRLELYRADGSRLMWYRLNRQWEPVSFGIFERELGTVLGPLQDTSEGVRLPIFSASHDGAFRAVDQRPTVYTTIPPVDFENP